MTSTQAEIFWEYGTDEQANEAWEAICQKARFIKRYGHLQRAISKAEAIHIFREELPGICWDHIKNGNNPDHWHEILTEIKNKKNLSFEDKKRRAKEVSIRELAERFGHQIRMSKTHCPFHEDPGASCHIYDRTNSFYCFGCQAGGDTIEWVKRKMGCTFVEAINYLT